VDQTGEANATGGNRPEFFPVVILLTTVIR